MVLKEEWPPECMPLASDTFRLELWLHHSRQELRQVELLSLSELVSSSIKCNNASHVMGLLH